MHESSLLLKLIGEEIIRSTSGYPLFKALGSRSEFVSATMFASLAEMVVSRWRERHDEEQQNAALNAILATPSETLRAEVDHLVHELGNDHYQAFPWPEDAGALSCYLLRVAEGMQLYSCLGWGANARNVLTACLLHPFSTALLEGEEAAEGAAPTSSAVTADVGGEDLEPGLDPLADQPSLGVRDIVSAAVWVLVGAAFAGLMGWLYGRFLPFGVGNVLAESWGIVAWLVLGSLFLALLATFGLCFGFGVVFNYFNGGFHRQILFFACVGGLAGLLLAALTASLYFMPAAGVGAVAGVIAAIVLFAAAAHLAYHRAQRSDGSGESEDAPDSERRALLRRRLGLLAMLVFCPLVGDCLTGFGWVPAPMLAGAVIGLVVGSIAGYYVGAVLSILTENLMGLVLGMGGCVLLGTIAGAAWGKSDLDGTYGLICTALRGGIVGAAMGMATAAVVGIVGSTLCPGSLGGSLGVALRLEAPSGAGTRGTFAALAGIFPGACLGLWTGTVLGLLHYWGSGPRDLLGWLAAASVAGGLLGLVFFGTRIVLHGAVTPRSAVGMLGVFLTGACLGGLASVLGGHFHVSVNDPAFWLLGQAVAGAFIAAKCWEFVGRPAG